MATSQFTLGNSSSSYTSYEMIDAAPLADGTSFVAWHEGSFVRTAFVTQDGVREIYSPGFNSTLIGSGRVAGGVDGTYVLTFITTGGDLRFQLGDPSPLFGAGAEAVARPLDTNESIENRAAVGLPQGGYAIIYAIENSSTGANTTHVLEVDMLGRVSASGARPFFADDIVDLDIIALSGGGFAALWIDEAGAVRYAQLDANLTPVAQTELFPGAPRIGADAQLVELANGDVAVLVDQFNPDFSRLRPIGQILEPNGTFVADIEAPATPIFVWGGTYSLAALAEGGFVIARDFGEIGVDYSRVGAFVHDNSGAIVGGAGSEPETMADNAMRVGDQQPAAVGLPGGGYMTAFWPGEFNATIVGRITGQTTALADAISLDAPGSISGGDGNDRIIGSEGDDVLRGDGDVDFLLGRGGDDDLEGGPGADYLYGGGGRDQIDGGVGNDVIEGGDREDDISGGLGQDILRGGFGADRIHGGLDIDRLFGGAGDDVIIGGDYGELDDFFDRLEEVLDDYEAGPDSDPAAYRDLVRQIVESLAGGLPPEPDANIIEAGSGADMVVGGDGDDDVQGDLGDDIVFGRGGEDRVYGGLGLDVLYGEEGSDRLVGGGGDDELFGGRGADLLKGGRGADRLSGGAGHDALLAGDDDDWIDAGVGDDAISGGDGDDEAHGGDGADLVSGGLGQDRLFGGDGVDVVLGGGDADRLSGDAGDDQMRGGGGNDFLFGGAGDDVLRGEAGRDQIRGEGGLDRIDGGAGNDVLIGGAASDLFIWSDGDGRDNINDFTVNVDLLHLGAVTGVNSFADLMARGTEVTIGGNTVSRFDFDDGGRLQLIGVALADLDAGDVIF